MNTYYPILFQDWWTSTTYSRFHRTWNVLVYDFMYTYIYKDVYEHIIPNNKFAAKATVFLTSAIFHEVIVICAFKLFAPIMFVMFFGVSFLLFSRIDKDSSNLKMHLIQLFRHYLGVCIVFCFYAMEFHTRRNVQVENISSIVPQFVYVLVR